MVLKILMVSALMVMAFASEYKTGQRLFRPNNSLSVVKVSENYQHTCESKIDDIKSALHQVLSGEFSQVEYGRNRLLDYAKESRTCRRTVVRALMERMDIPNLKFEGESKNYRIWREGSLLLGELRATEALDLLISHLDLTNGFHSNSKIFQPAILGVRQMGQAAVPKLTVAVRENPRAGVRMAAAYCLTEIGGLSAMNALKQAQKTETDQCVTRFIALSLNTFSYKSKGRVIFDNKAPQANADARQNWLMAFECVDTETATAKRSGRGVTSHKAATPTKLNPSHKLNS